MDYTVAISMMRRQRSLGCRSQAHDVLGDEMLMRHCSWGVGGTVSTPGNTVSTVPVFSSLSIAHLCYHAGIMD